MLPIMKSVFLVNLVTDLKISIKNNNLNNICRIVC